MLAGGRRIPPHAVHIPGDGSRTQSVFSRRANACRGENFATSKESAYFHAIAPMA